VPVSARNPASPSARQTRSQRSSMVGYGYDTWSRCRRCGSTETSDPIFGPHTNPAPWPPPRQRQDGLDPQTTSATAHGPDDTIDDVAQ
jgi:hypothetical protein